MVGILVMALMALPFTARADHDDDRTARPRDLQRLQEDARNIDEELATLEPGDRLADGFRERAEELREEVIYLKVKMRHHERAGGSGTGLTREEVSTLRRAIGDLLGDIRSRFRGRRPGGPSAPGHTHRGAPRGALILRHGKP